MHDLEFELKPSTQYLIFLLAVVVISTSIIFFLPLDLWMKWIGGLLVLAYTLPMAWRFGLLRSRRHSVTRMTCRHDGRWLFYTARDVYDVELMGDSTVTRLVSIVRFRTPQQRFARSCLVFRDSLPPEAYRQLRVMLKSTPMDKG